jgi:hypothetical protein
VPLHRPQHHALVVFHVVVDADSPVPMPIAIKRRKRGTMRWLD